jgi:hypothetical protein
MKSTSKHRVQRLIQIDTSTSRPAQKTTNEPIIPITSTPSSPGNSESVRRSLRMKLFPSTLFSTKVWDVLPKSAEKKLENSSATKAELKQSPHTKKTFQHQTKLSQISNQPTLQSKWKSDIKQLDIYSEQFRKKQGSESPSKLAMDSAHMRSSLRISPQLYSPLLGEAIIQDKIRASLRDESPKKLYYLNQGSKAQKVNLSISKENFMKYSTILKESPNKIIAQDSVGTSELLQSKERLNSVGKDANKSIRKANHKDLVQKIRSNLNLHQPISQTSSQVQKEHKRFGSTGFINLPSSKDVSQTKRTPKISANFMKADSIKEHSLRSSLKAFIGLCKSPVFLENSTTNPSRLPIADNSILAPQTSSKEFPRSNSDERISPRRMSNPIVFLKKNSATKINLPNGQIIGEDNQKHHKRGLKSIRSDGQIPIAKKPYEIAPPTSDPRLTVTNGRLTREVKKDMPKTTTHTRKPSVTSLGTELKNQDKNTSLEQSRGDVSRQMSIFKKFCSSKKDSVPSVLVQPTFDHPKLSTFHSLGLLGEGASCKVRLIQEVRPGETRKFALKTLDKFSSSLQLRRNLENEGAILSLIKHPNIVTLIDKFESKRYSYLLLEYLPNVRSLQSIIDKNNNQKIKEKIAKAIMQRVANALVYLHSQLIFHRDLKLDNILCSSPLEENSTVKLIDFGFATKLKELHDLKVVCGTPSYIAPEIVSGQNYCPIKADVWAFGVCLYRLLVGEFPFKGADLQGLYLNIRRSPLSIPEYLSAPARQLLAQLLNKTAELRPQISAVLNHQFFSCQ